MIIPSLADTSANIYVQATDLADYLVRKKVPFRGEIPIRVTK